MPKWIGRSGGGLWSPSPSVCIRIAVSSGQMRGVLSSCPSEVSPGEVVLHRPSRGYTEIPSKQALPVEPWSVIPLYPPPPPSLSLSLTHTHTHTQSHTHTHTRARTLLLLVSTRRMLLASKSTRHDGKKQRLPGSLPSVGACIRRQCGEAFKTLFTTC